MGMSTVEYVEIMKTLEAYAEYLKELRNRIGALERGEKPKGPKIVKKEGWVNVYRSPSSFAAVVSDAFASKAEADLGQILGRVACIRIEWEEEV